MTAKEVKRWFLEIRGTDKELKRLEELRKKTYESITKTTATLSSDPGGGSTDPHKFDSLLEIDEKIANRINDINSERIKRMNAITLLKKPQHRTLMIDYYLNNADNWNTVAENMNYSRMQVNRLHGEALAELAKMLLNVTTDL